MSNDAATSWQEPNAETAACWEAEAALQRLAHAHVPAHVGFHELASVLSALADDSDIEAPEALLRKAEAKYRALVEQIPAVTFKAPLDGTTSELYVSPQIEQLLGFSAQESLNERFLLYPQL